MKITQINASASSIGGAGRIAVDLRARYDARGHHSVLYAGTGVSKETATLKTISKSAFHSLLARLAADDFSHFNTDYLLNLADFFAADVIHAHNLHGWYFNLRTLQKISERKPVVWTLHDMWAITPHCAHSYEAVPRHGFFACRSRRDYPGLWWRNDARLAEKKRALYARTAVHLVCPSAWLAEKVSLSVLADKPRTVIPNGVDVALFAPRSRLGARAKLGLPADKKIALFIANQGLKNEFKGGDLFLRLASTYGNDVIFLCVGEKADGSYGNVVIRRGTSDIHDLADYYSAADAYLMPSAAENFPLVVLEAQACGLPVVAHDVGGVKEAIVHRSTGYLAAYRDVQDLRVGLEYFFNKNDAEREAARQVCRARAQAKFSLEAMAEAYLSLYQTLI
jgi:glycosyltransferase involved in cell wall biosynthesis